MMLGRKIRGLSEPPAECGGNAEASMQARLNRLSATYGLSNDDDLNFNGIVGPLDNCPDNRGRLAREAATASAQQLPEANGHNGVDVRF